MNLAEAIQELQNNEKLLDVIYTEGLSQSFILVDKAICILIAEHGPNYFC